MPGVTGDGCDDAGGRTGDGCDDAGCRTGDGCDDGRMDTLMTDRLLLREWTHADADFVFDLYSRWDVQRYIGREPRVMAERSQAEQRIAQWRAMEHPLHGIWAVEGPDGLVGSLLLKSIPASGERTPPLPSGDTEIGWHFHPDAWGHGYATEAAVAVRDRAFARGLERIVAVTNPSNIASQRVCLRLGMTHEGPTDQYYDETCELFTLSTPGGVRVSGVVSATTVASTPRAVNTPRH